MGMWVGGRWVGGRCVCELVLRLLGRWVEIQVGSQGLRGRKGWWWLSAQMGRRYKLTGGLWVDG